MRTVEASAGISFHGITKEHRHSGIGLLTPEAVHHGLTDEICKARSEVLQAAYDAHPERFVKKIPVPPTVPEAARINKPKPTAESEGKVH